MHFQGACLAPLQISRLALVLADGSTCLLALQADMEAQLRLEPLKIRGGTRTAPAPVDVKLLSADLLFVAAHLGSSALFRVATSPSQQRRTRVPHGEHAVSGKFASREPDLELHQHDTIFQLGPVVDLVAIPPQFESRGGIQMPAELLCCTGHGRESFLARFIYHVQTRDWQRIPSSGCRRVWSLFAHDPSKPNRSEEQAYLLLSLAKSSVILDVRHGFEQAADSQVMLPSATIAAGNLDQHRLIAQVHRSGVRLLDSGLDLVLEYDVLLVTLEPGAAIIGASILDPYISLWLSDYRLTVLRLASRADDDQKESRYQLTTVFSTEGMLCATLYRGTLVNDFQTACSLPSEQIWSTPWTMTSKSTESYLRNAKTTASGTHDEMSLVLDSEANRTHTLDSPDLLIELAEEEQFLYGTNGWKQQPKRTQVPGDERILSSEGTASPRAISRRSIPPSLDCFLAAATVDGALYLYGLAGDQPPLLLLQCKRFFLGVANIRDDRPNGVRPTEGDASWRRGAGPATPEMPLPENVPSAFGTAHLLNEDANEPSSKSKPLVTDTYPRSSRDVTEATAKSFSEAASAPNEPVARRLRQGKVLDICLKDLGSRVCPVLAAILASGEVIIYKGFVAAGGKLCFTRIGGNALSTAFMPPFGSAMTAPGGGISSTGATTGATERDGKTGSRRSGAMRLMPFQNIQGKSGLTIIGQRVYIVLGDAGYPTVHPVRGPGLLSLTELHHAEACPYGFVSVATDGTVRIGQWPSLAHTRAVGHFLVQKHAWSESEYVERLLHDPSTDTILAIAGRSVPATEAVVRYLLEGNRYEAALRHARRKQQQKEQGNGTSAAAADVEVVAEHVSQSANARLSTAGRPSTRVRSLDKSIGQHGPVADVDVSEDAMEIDKDSNGTAALPVKTHELDESISLDEPDGNTDPMAEFEEQKRRRFQSERARDLPLLVDQHAVVLFARHSFEVLARYELEQTEVGLSMCSTRIRHFQRTADEEVPRFTERDVLVVGTTYVRGEDTTIRGRLLVFEISRQEGHGRTLYQMQTLAATEVKGAVSSVAPIKGGFICCSAGPRLEVYKLIEDEMSCISYYPGINLFFSHVTTLKQYILASDLRLGVSFLFWRERNVSQNFLCRDEAPRELVASEWVMHGTQACVISADMLGNILELSIPSPLDPESGGGTRMTFEAAMHIGSRANVLRRVRIDDPRIQEANNELPILWNTHVVLVGTADGMISLICPLLRPTAKKLSLASLYLMLEPEVRKWALNARTFRTMRALTLRGGLQKSRRTILDGDVLQLYGFLDTPRRKEIARKLGVPQEMLFESIFSSVEAVLQVL
ncbi:Cleavage and polyadenylation specificity factor subunit 1 [Cyanidiococcus yangmingshanensis]|uniref:Cleavage and polyadenylation specificity factor subunit 1 n=1 Tax=Cyanidiococcus yangmingshanensis TaxID=2690220 RepID=A0A7J7ILU1_9RHOD|nr:Cleavage and polyadenylation specificity factor subunit 1 [Cyanidiococcus yangmingshanensis]